MDTTIEATAHEPETPGRDTPDQITESWSNDAPRGGKAVMNRMIKENATVPLFFAQTLIQSLRDVGYNHTTSALCEHVDNAFQAGASEIRVFFRQASKREGGAIDVAVYDNGKGMAPVVLKAATAFGGSLNFGNRDGIGRFGMGMKTAALSLSPIMELYSWQEPKAIYGMTLDIDAIGRDRSNLVELPDATLHGEFPTEQAALFTGFMSFPPDHSEQSRAAESEEGLYDRLGSSGTLVYMPACDRLADALASGQSDAIKTYLGVMARFHHYSFCNQLLILAQRPESTHVAGYQRWQALGRQVRQGERSIHILAPLMKKRQEPEAGQDGALQRLCGFRVAYVFDVAQTVGKPLPSAPQAQGDPGANLEGVKALYAQKGIALEYKGNLDGAEGLSAKGKVYVLDGLEPAREFAVLVHELAHELLHGGERRKQLSRKVKETEAEAVAYAVGLSVGLDMNTASADYISLYNGDRDTLRESLESITRIASQILSALTENRAN